MKHLHRCLMRMILLTACLLTLAAAPVHADITTGLVGWWKMSDATTTEVPDSSGNGNHLSLGGSPATASIAGKTGLRFDGVDDFGTNSSAAFALNTFTVSTWIYIEGYDPNGSYVINNTKFALSYSLFPASNPQRFMFGASIWRLGAGGRTTGGFATTSASSEWHHLVHTYSASDWRTYIDGQVISFGGGNASQLNNATTLYIGKFSASGSGNSIKGVLSDTRIYNRILSAADVSDLYALASQPPISLGQVAQNAYLKSSNTGGDDRFGFSVAVDGDTMVVGAPSEDSNATGVNGAQSNNNAADSGAVYVFVRSGGAWSQQAYLKAGNSEAGDEFGRTVAISGDTLVVGAYLEDSSATGINGNAANNSALNSGAAYVFVRNSGVWSQQAYLKASNTATEDRFGISVAINGETIVVGAPNEDSAATIINGDGSNNAAESAGAAYVYARSGTTWSQEAYLKAGNAGSANQFGVVGDRFGSVVAISNDTIVVGAPFEASNATGVNGNGSNNSTAWAGAAYVFVRSGASWSQQAYLKASTTGSMIFASSVAVSGDDVVVGAPQESGSGANASGAAYVFSRSGTNWAPQAYLKASNIGANDSFGIAVAIKPDLIAVGAGAEASAATGINGDGTNNNASNSGATYVFARSAGAWTQDYYLKASNTNASDLFGAAVAIDDDFLIVGARGEASNATGVNGSQSDNSLANAGAAYIFDGLVPVIPSIPDMAIAAPGNNPIADGGERGFGNVLTNGNYVTLPFVMSNPGTGQLTGIETTITGTGASNFSFINALPASIAPGGSATFGIKFQPTTVGAKTALLRVASNDPDENPYEITLTGTGLLSPAVPALVTPGSKTAPGSTLTTLTPTFTWRAVAGAVGYNFTLREAEGTLLHSETGIGVTTSFAQPVGHLRPGGRYQWTMQARNAGGPGTESAPFYFNVAQELPRPSAPVLRTPGSAVEPAKVVSSLNPTFTWTTSNGVLGHEIVVFDQLTNSTLHHSTSLTGQASYSLPTGTLTAGGNYRWRLRARNAVGYGPWSPSFYFQTARLTPLPPAPVLVFPGAALTDAPPLFVPPDAASFSAATQVSKATVMTNALRPFEWKPIAGAQSYTLTINETNSDAPPVVQTNVAAPATTFSLPPGRLETNKVYRWVVVANTATGSSPASKARHFKTPVRWPAPVISTVSPTQVVSSTTAQWIRLDGTGFQPGVSIWLTAPGASEKRVVTARTQFVTSRIMRFRMPITPAGSWSVRVLNPDLQSSSNASFIAVAPGGTLLPPVLTPAPTAAALAQHLSVSLSQSNAAGTEIRYTLDGTAPDRFSTLYEGTPIFMGSQSRHTIRAICVNDTAPPSTVTTGDYRFTLPSLPLTSSGPLMDDIPLNASRVFRLTMVSGRATFSIRSDSSQPIGNLRFYIAKDRIPTEADYDDRSVRNPLLQSVLTEQQQMTDLPALPGTYFVLVKRGNLSGPLGRLTVSITTGAQTVPPIVKPNSGFHFAPLRLVMEHPRWFTTIYYTLDGSSPQPPPFGQGKTFAYTDPSSHSTGMRIRASAYRSRERMSTVVERLYNIGNNDINLTLEPDNVWDSDFVQTRKTSLSTVVNWGPGARVERTFSFTVPEDPRVEANSSQITYPVALLMNVETQGIPQPLVYLLENGPTPVKSNSAGAFLVSNLPKLDSDRDYHSLGPVQVPKSYRTRNMKGRALRPGATYYGLIQTWGALIGSGQLKIDFQLHSARLESSTPPIKYAVDQTTALDNSWIVIHGRDNHASSPRIIDAADALVAATTATPIVARQVLRLNWGTLAKPSGSGPLSLWGIGSLDEAMFTECVGKRTDTILTQWGILPSDRSLLGHSWGSYVAYEVAKGSGTAKVKRLIALDPAATGTGNYPDSEINFAKYASKSWSIVSAFTPVEMFGSYRYASTAGETFAFHSTSELPSPLSLLRFMKALHNTPLDLFTHLTLCNYDATYPHYGEAIIAPRFAIQRMDNGQGGAPHQLNALPRYINDPLGDSGPPNVPQRLRTLEGIFEGTTDAASEGLNLTDPAALRLRIITGGVETPLQPIWP